MRPEKGKAIPLHAWERPSRFQEVEAPRFQDNRHMKVIRLSALRTSRLYPQGHSAAGRIMSMKNFNDTIGMRPETPLISSDTTTKFISHK